jgi:hypothetical protein
MIKKVAALIQRCAKCLQAGVSVSMLGMFDILHGLIMI